MGLARREGGLQGTNPLYLPRATPSGSQVSAMPSAIYWLYQEGFTIGGIWEGSLKIGPFTFSFTPTKHNMEAHLVKISSGDGVLTYSGDTGF